MISRTLLKTMSYATMHMTVAITVAYALSRDWNVALAIGLVEPCFQTVAFFFHERAWHKIEKTAHETDYHDSVIDSVSPAAGAVDEILHQGDKRPVA